VHTELAGADEVVVSRSDVKPHQKAGALPAPSEPTAASAAVGLSVLASTPAIDAVISAQDSCCEHRNVQSDVRRSLRHEQDRFSEQVPPISSRDERWSQVTLLLLLLLLLVMLANALMLLCAQLTAAHFVSLSLFCFAHAEEEGVVFAGGK
jgi:hypothetical protein